jgi:hypothetical protein
LAFQARAMRSRRDVFLRAFDEASKESIVKEAL